MNILKNILVVQQSKVVINTNLEKKTLARLIGVWINLSSWLTNLKGVNSGVKYETVSPCLY